MRSTGPSAAQIDEHEEWLARHTVRCDRYQMRISPENCARYQKTSPERCVKCVRWDRETQPDVSQTPGRLFVVRKNEEVDVSKTKRVATCVKCGRTRSITGRKMCSCCYTKVLRAERDQMIAAESNGVISTSTTPLVDISSVGGNVAQKTVSKHVPVTTLILEFTSADLALFEKLQSLAQRERRDPAAQALCLLEEALVEN